MSFFGMGQLEILLVLVIAFVLLGPERMIDAARLLGRALREGRRLASELPQVVIEDDDIKIVNRDASHSSHGMRSPEPTEEPESPKSADAPADEDGPVSFKAGDEAPSPRDTPAQRDS